MWKVIIYLMRRFSHELSENEKSNAVKITLYTSDIQYFIPRELKNHVKVAIFRLEWHTILFDTRAKDDSTLV